MKSRKWTPQDEEILNANVNVIPMFELCKLLNRTENSINIKLLRLRVERKKGGINKEMVSRNMVIEMLTQRIGNPDNFLPTREFLNRVQIGQKRFWQLYRGEKNIKDSEYRSLAREWNMTLEDAFMLRQCELKFDE